MLLVAIGGLLLFTSGCATQGQVESPVVDQFGRTVHNSEPDSPFRADSYVVKVAGAEYTPNVIVIHGEWIQLRWFQDGKYLQNDVWIPRSSISAIEEKHK